MDITVTYPFIVGLVLGHTLKVAVRSGLLGEAYAIARTLRVGDFSRTVGPLAAAMAIAAGLSQIPGFTWGWTSLLGGEGNLLLGTGGGNTLVPLIAIGVLLVVLPVLVLMEEQVFRVGAEDRSRRQRWQWSALFGACHAIVGVPLAGVAALTFAGWWFTHRYLRGWNGAAGMPIEARRQAALEGAVRAHMAWNYVAVLLLWAALARSAAG